MNLRTTRNLTIIAAAALCSLASFVAGCGSNAKVEAKSTTIGQELQDLDAAYDKGLLTEDEYKKSRKKIMDQK